MNEKTKKLLRELVDHTCEVCHKTEFELSRDGKIVKLIIHHIRRKNTGGSDNHRNLMVVCPTCHKRIHANEFRCKSK